MLTRQAVTLVRKHLLNPSGQCYVAAEAIFHLSMEKLKPCVMPCPEGPHKTHWFLRDQQGRVIDPTVHQFIRIPNYSIGKGCGFLTKAPSKRAAQLMQRIQGVSDL